MSNQFSSLGVSPSILKAIEEMGFSSPTDVQQEVIPYILNRQDLIVMSKTGSGKTASFGIPILQLIDQKEKVQGPVGLILAPTRELAVQVDQDLKKMSKYLHVRTTAVYGQHDIRIEIQALKQGADIVTGTPGRVFDHIKRKNLDTRNIQFLVLDEADRMLDMGFIEQMMQIIKELPKKRVTLLFSATMPPEIKRICRSYMYQPLTIELQSETKTVDTVKQIYYRVQPKEKRLQLHRVLQAEQPERCMIFCNTRDESDRVQAFLAQKGHQAEVLHGANSQNHRMKTIEKFKKGTVKIVVATDVAARGIHIDDLSLVVNYDVPNDKNSYVHRIGRTARAGNSGKAIMLATSDDIMSLYEIEEHVGVLIDEMPLPTDEYIKACTEKAAIAKKQIKKDQPARVPKQGQKKEEYKASQYDKREQERKSSGQKNVQNAPRDSKAEIKETTIPAAEGEARKLKKASGEEGTPKNPKEVTIMVKNLGPVKVTYVEEPKEKISFVKRLKFVQAFIGLFHKEK